MSYGIKLLQIREIVIDPPEWLTYYDPDAGDLAIEYPTGAVESDTDPALALRFASFEEAAECWKLQSERTPYRPDGKPNRPLSAFTVEIESLEEKP